jgi:hypothetical protein
MYKSNTKTNTLTGQSVSLSVKEAICSMIIQTLLCNILIRSNGNKIVDDCGHVDNEMVSLEPESMKFL